MLFFSTYLASKTATLMSPSRNSTNASVIIYNLTIVYLQYIDIRYIQTIDVITNGESLKSNHQTEPTANGNVNKADLSLSNTHMIPVCTARHVVF